MIIYHMCKAEEWQAAEAAGTYGGSSQDIADGFIHFSTAEHIVASAAKHRAGQDGYYSPMSMAVSPFPPSPKPTPYLWTRTAHTSSPTLAKAPECL